MDYKEKYKMALEGIQEILGSGEDSIKMSRLQLRLQGIFPELEESKDEKIKKEILEYFYQFENGELRGVDITSWISWLEKQVSPDIVADAYLRGCNDTEKKWLKKQGEQKPTDKIEPRFKVGDYIERKDGLGCHAEIIFVGGNVYGCEKLIHSEDESPFFEFMFKNQDEFQISSDFKQKPADKVEPKFKVGDWVVQGCNILNIRCVGDKYYCFETVGGYVDDMLVSEIDSQFHLWTIQDAKDGDVLQLGKVTAIFKSYISNGNCECYCSVCDGDFEIPSQDGADNSYGCHNAIPATKEQRDQLEKAMTDAGWEFGFEKKELKKIEKSAWSEEDKRMLRYAVDFVSTSPHSYAGDIFRDEIGKDEVINWLKSLKDRVKPQPKQEWSEEDIVAIDCAVEVLSKDLPSLAASIERLKSLRPQNRWKPSEEQMAVLNEVINHAANSELQHWSSFIYTLLKSLREQLKKLKG